MKAKMWTISFQYWNIVFCPENEKPSVTTPENYHVFDDLQIENAWKALVEEHRDVWVWTCDMYRVMRFVMGRHIYIKAAGGIVTDPQGDALLIYRNEHWDLPKGMIEHGETPTEGAVREVEEETGLKAPKIERLLLESYHVYDLYGGWHIKKTYWYEMRCDFPTPLAPQTEEGITRCEWCTPQEREEHLGNSYSMMKMINTKLR